MTKIADAIILRDEYDMGLIDAHSNDYEMHFHAHAVITCFSI